jgi:hypothetical protein
MTGKAKGQEGKGKERNTTIKGDGNWKERKEF